MREKKNKTIIQIAAREIEIYLMSFVFFLGFKILQVQNDDNHSIHQFEIKRFIYFFPLSLRPLNITITELIAIVILAIIGIGRIPIGILL
ncbi:MAG: hypothetical protein PHE21_04030 [Candidatus Dojkabacteria bacterium]|nr:hypothetical protein [Candidatus Dojkabacteria bacterium]